ncbi:hypothetical protein [Microbulbifer halophilus]|uniref:Uncharacterized protein n=1 Tax=Microbulbifer halophilus TaxID=453963 RepID=A0ABW5EAY6_9GAMM|nr:hypothetical protein [Microbulbifer halophilus]MCW8125105.1 hypothetical protein [Microbulbifer halophilus]
MARPTESSEDPAAQHRSRDELPPRDESSNEENTLERAQATLTLATAWLANLQSLAQLEFSRTLVAGKRILALQLLLLPLALALVLSLCGGAGLLGYYFSQSIYVGFAVFVLVQLLIVAGILLYHRRLSAMLGFHETRRQAKEAISDVFQSIK